MSIPLPPTETITLQVLGGAELRGLEATVADRLLVQPKVVGLLAYLALAGEPGRFYRRDHLMALFWPELDQAHAGTALRKAVHSVRTTIGAEALPGRGREELALARSAVTCDATEFTEAVNRGRLAESLEIYRGDLLPGFHLSECDDFERWLDGKRVALREEAGGAALALAHLFERDASLTVAIKWARKAARFAWNDERILRRAMLLLDRGGDRGGAVQLYTDFATRLKEEFDAEPSAETVALLGQFRSTKPPA